MTADSASAPSSVFKSVKCITGDLGTQPNADSTRSEFYVDANGDYFDGAGFLDAPTIIPAGGTTAAQEWFHKGVRSVLQVSYLRRERVQ